jgi:energy-coupling factor transporter ATP-binding protein EcfA2
LIFLDEPTSGLDPGLDRQVMQMLRKLADEGRTVAVVTHSVLNLRLCDRILVLAPGGLTAYFGPPDEALHFFGREDWADVFQAFDEYPDFDWAERYRGSVHYQMYSADVEAVAPRNAPVQDPGSGPRKPQGWLSQLITLTRRYCGPRPRVRGRTGAARERAVSRIPPSSRRSSRGRPGAAAGSGGSRRGCPDCVPW